MIKYPIDRTAAKFRTPTIEATLIISFDWFFIVLFFNSVEYLCSFLCCSSNFWACWSIIFFAEFKAVVVASNELFTLVSVCCVWFNAVLTDSDNIIIVSDNGSTVIDIWFNR